MAGIDIRSDAHHFLRAAKGSMDPPAVSSGASEEIGSLGRCLCETANFLCSKGASGRLGILLAHCGPKITAGGKRIVRFKFLDEEALCGNSVDLEN